ncbi:MAG: acetate kinase [Campylobacterales bacterium]|nr:acetate kinase [Campylobacterales bacterium]
MNILVINAGSSSLKYTLFDGEALHVKGLIEEVQDHHRAFLQMQEALHVKGIELRKLDAIAHRVVHGGERFSAPALIDAALIDAIKTLTPLAPLHNPANLEGIIAARALAPDVPNIAVFDTAFHQSMPEHAYRYPLPHELYKRYGVRRYGFHGTSHRFVAAQAAQILDRDLLTCNLITLHIGNGVSACAIEQGRSVDTSMGLTPLEGLMMGTRCGSIDPGIVPYLMRVGGFSGEEIDVLMNKRSGLKAIGGESDMRLLIEAMQSGSADATLAIEMFAYRLKKQLGSYMAALEGVDAVVFTGGIGEHAPLIRSLTCKGLAHLGIELDEAKNAASQTQIHSEQSRVALLVIPTDEERQIASDAQTLLQSR